MKTMPAPTLMLKRTVNNWNEMASQRHVVKFHPALNHCPQMIETEPHPASSDTSLRLTFFARPLSTGEPAMAKSAKDLIDRPPQRWGINE